MFFYNDCSIPGAQMLEIVKNKEFWRLPPAMSEAAQEAYDVLLHTGDGQLCDVIVDRAALKAISEAGRNAEDAIIRDYARVCGSNRRYQDCSPFSENRKKPGVFKACSGTLRYSSGGAFGKSSCKRHGCDPGIICSQLPMQVGQKHWQSHRPHLSGGVTTG